MLYLAKQRHLRYLYKLVLFNCNLDVQERSFHQFISAFPIKIAKINCKFRNYQLDNKAVYKIMELDIVAVYGKTQFLYNGITDHLLQYWEKNPPVQVAFTHVEAKFTVDGIIRLIKSSVASMTRAEYSLGVIRISTNEFRKFLKFIQLTRQLSLRGRNETTEHTPRCISVTCKNLSYFCVTFYYKFTEDALQ